MFHKFSWDPDSHARTHAKVESMLVRGFFLCVWGEGGGTLLL